MFQNRINILINKRLLAVLLLGFASGLPLALTGATLQAWFTEAGVGLVSIGMLSLLGMPYALKFVWAPCFDHYRLPGGDRRKGWILLTQAGLVISLLLLAQMNPGSQASSMGMIALLVAFLSASQDIAVDAYRTDLLAADERGLGAACYVFAYRVAALISGGLALVCADYFGWRWTYEGMALLMLLAMIPTLAAPSLKDQQPRLRHMLQTVAASMSDLLQRDKIIVLLLFVIFYKFGDAMALSLMMNFLLHGLGFTLTEVGLAYKTVSFIATILGAFVGGAILTRKNLYYGLFVFGVAQAFSNLMFVLLAMAGKQFLLMTVSIFIENFCSGLSTAAFFAFLMSICNQRFTASQFALLSAAASLGRVFLGPLAGYLVEHVGWVQFYMCAFLLSFPGLYFLMLLKNKVLSYAEAVQQ